MSYAQVYLEIVASIEFLTLESASSRSNQVIDQVIVPEDLGSIMITSRSRSQLQQKEEGYMYPSSFCLPLTGSAVSLAGRTGAVSLGPGPPGR